MQISIRGLSTELKRCSPLQVHHEVGDSKTKARMLVSKNFHENVMQMIVSYKNAKRMQATTNNMQMLQFL